MIKSIYQRIPEEEKKTLAFSCHCGEPAEGIDPTMKADVESKIYTKFLFPSRNKNECKK